MGWDREELEGTGDRGREGSPTLQGKERGAQEQGRDQSLGTHLVTNFAYSARRVFSSCVTGPLSSLKQHILGT